ncbi:mechanosensitive ion channel family protein [Paenibacillaceae bacterium T2]|uniref:Mechanosensitive ion channel family protein n=1 Tax=Ferviditalea candida TaxID=3108399 RepID=A0ABU5ZL37_9BACL|nr:mechanosensitive ion channel family protein [Paenibacillaceae bacterium T2]
MQDQENKYKQLIDNTISYITDPQIWINILITAVKIALIYLIGKMAKKVAHKTLEKIFRDRERSPLKWDERRSMTIGKLAKNIVNYSINFIVILMILSQIGVELMPLLAGAGVVGLAVGFGAQSLVKDVISGFFIIFEDQFGVGDVIQVGNFKGTVEQIGLRVTRIRSWTGEVNTIPNGSITEVTNFSVHNSLAVVDVSIAYEENIDQVMSAIQETADRLFEKNGDIVKQPEVLGVQSLGVSEVTIRVICECKPVANLVVERQLKSEIKKRFDELGIEIPYPKVVTYQRMEKVES